jgi:hypothetical protein
MLTPAEEHGLAGLAVASRVQHALYRLAPAELAGVIERLRAGALADHVVYLHEGDVEPIRILPAPITILPDQLAYVHHVTLTVQNALKRLPSLYLHDFTVREILRLPDAEEAWLRECWGLSHEEHNPVFGRLDALVDFTSPMWKESLRFVEPNLMGIGGLHLVPTCERLIADIVVPVLRVGDDALDLAVGQDMRELLTGTLLEHAAATGCGRQVCVIEPKHAGSGPDEQAQLAHYLERRHGLRVMHADPSELAVRDGAVWYAHLIDFACGYHEALVLKPNRAYGGDGIVIGPAVTREQWEAALAAALEDPDDRWVVQQVASIPVREFPVVGADGAVHAEPFYTVMGSRRATTGWRYSRGRLRSRW